MKILWSVFAFLPKKKTMFLFQKLGFQGHANSGTQKHETLSTKGVTSTTRNMSVERLW
jgi:hypothetical protein